MDPTHISARLGGQTRVAFGPDAGDQVVARFGVVDAESLIPSHRWSTIQPDSRYPRWLQGRAYSGVFGRPSATIVATQVLERMYVLDPTLFPWGGPPICTSRGWVVAGNHRAILLQRAALWVSDERHVAAYERYREALFGSLPMWGLHPDAVLAFRAPILVRMLEDAQWAAVSDDERDMRLLRLNVLSDRPPTKAYDHLSDGFAMATSLLQARGRTAQDAIAVVRQFVGDSSLDSVLRGRRGSAFLAALAQCGAVTSAEYPALIDPVQDHLSPAGRSRITWMMRALLIDDRAILASTPRHVFRQLEGHWDRLLAAAYGHVGLVVRSRLREAFETLTADGADHQASMLEAPLDPRLRQTRSRCGELLAACVSGLGRVELGCVLDRWLPTLVPVESGVPEPLFAGFEPPVVSGGAAERAVLTDALSLVKRRGQRSTQRVPDPEAYLTTTEWAMLEPLMPRPARSTPRRLGGRPPHSNRALAAGVVYVLAHGATIKTVVSAWATLPPRWIARKRVCRRTTLQRRLAQFDLMPGGRVAFLRVADAIAAARR